MCPGALPVATVLAAGGVGPAVVGITRWGIVGAVVRGIVVRRRPVARVLIWRAIRRVAGPGAVRRLMVGLGLARGGGVAGAIVAMGGAAVRATPVVAAAIATPAQMDQQ